MDTLKLRSHVKQELPRRPHPKPETPLFVFVNYTGCREKDSRLYDSQVRGRVMRDFVRRRNMAQQRNLSAGAPRTSSIAKAARTIVKPNSPEHPRDCHARDSATDSNHYPYPELQQDRHAQTSASDPDPAPRASVPVRAEPSQTYHRPYSSPVDFGISASHVDPFDTFPCQIDARVGELLRWHLFAPPHISPIRAGPPTTTSQTSSLRLSLRYPKNDQSNALSNKENSMSRLNATHQTWKMDFWKLASCSDVLFPTMLCVAAAMRSTMARRQDCPGYFEYKGKALYRTRRYLTGLSRPQSIPLALLTATR